ncbi:MAG TPA: aminotransferase class V-fold PLP-dependent enzyme, partial [Saprospiraceae bacterium]|nr:aminotransferase class V-fold PLP-dependent enzyme [Saprospiraceae bacterium]
MSNFEKNVLRDQIRMLEKSARSLEPDAARRQEWNDESTRFASDFIESLPAGKAFQSFGSLKGSLELHLESEPAQTMAECLEELRHGVLSKGLNPASGGHLGYIPGGGIYGGVLGDYLAALTNQYAGIFFGGPGAVKIENELIRWLCRLFGFPATSHGNLASGGSIANLIALVTAREARHIQSADIPRLCIYLTGQVHHCIHKAIRISGLGESQVRTIPTDSAYRMDPQALQRQIRQDADAGLQPFLVVASAGTTDTGAIDPLDRIADIAEASGLWFHVDAAYGGFFILCEDPETTGDYRDALKGIERSDSLVVDPHKGLFLSYGLGAVLIK